MRSFRTSRRLGHAAAKMFELAADVERYPEFLPLCEALTVKERRPTETGEVIVADMRVAYKAFRETFTSRVLLDRVALVIDTEYLHGPFRHLENRWQFVPDGADACMVDFSIAYAFRSRLFELAAGAVFDAAFRKFAAAFERRADDLYGTQSAGSETRN